MKPAASLSDPTIIKTTKASTRIRTITFQFVPEGLGCLFLHSLAMSIRTACLL